MHTTHTQIKKIDLHDNANHLVAQLMYPKMVIFEDSRHIRVVNIIDKNEEDCCYTLDSVILDKCLQDHHLWLIKKCGAILIIDIFQGKQLTINNDNHEKFKLHHFKHYQCNMYLISESGECLEVPFNSKELAEKLQQGLTEVTVNLKKIHIPNFNSKQIAPVLHLDGMDIFTELGALKVTCPITGISETTNTTVHVDQVVIWDELTVITNKLNMWVVNMKNSQLIFEFEEHNVYYYPVVAFKDSLYYLSTNNKELQICCTRMSSPSDEYPDDQENSNSPIQTLSTQETLILEMRSLVDSILASKPVKVTTKLQLLFDKIEDLLFLINTASKLCQHSITYKSILYSLQKRVFATNDNNVVNMLCDLIIKIDLLEYIQFRSNKCYNNINLFELSFKELCQMFLSKSDLDIASICWLKYSEMKLVILPDDVIDILNAIPYNTKMGAVIVWMKNFVPSLLEQNPFYIDLFVRWTMERVFKLEQSPYWPKIGTKYIDEIILVLATSLQTIPIRPSSMDDLDILKDRINDIMELKDKYKINMLLEELSSQSPSEVALIMLRRCYTEDLELFLQEYLPSYTTRHLFDLDDTLRSFIECEAASSGGGIDGVRLKILLNAFHSLNSKLDCLLQVLKVLDVPWNSTVLELAMAAAASATKDFTVTDADQVLAQEIQKELNYAKLKVILKKYNFPLTCKDYTLVLHKIINSSTVDLEDLKVITSVVTTHTNYGNILYIDRCLHDCETKTALDYFNTLSTKEKNISLKAIITKYEQIINRDINENKITERNYLDFLKGTKCLTTLQTSNIEKIYQLKNSYDVALNMNSIYNENNHTHEITSWLNKDVEITNTGKSDIQLIDAYLTGHSALLALLRRTSTSHKVRNLVQSFMRIPINLSEVHPNKESVLSCFKDGQNASMLLNFCNLMIELITASSEDYLHNLIKHLSMLNALINANIVVKNLSVTWKFHYIYLPISSSTALNELIDFYESIKTLSTFDNAIVNKCDFISLRMISHAVSNLNTSGPLCDDLLEMKDKAINKLLTKVIASPDLDELLITSLLLILRRVEEVEDSSWVLEVLKGQNECLPPSIIYYLSSPLVRRTFIFDNDASGNGIQYPPQHVLKTKFNINLSEMVLPENTEETWDVKVILFYVLRQYPETSFQRLMDLCCALNVSINDGLSLQLISLLSSWELKYKILYDELGNRQLVTENKEKELLKCFLIWESIDNKSFLRDILIDFWKNGEITLHGRIVSINPYYYEVFLCIYHLIFDSSTESISIKEYFLLNFLKEYSRKSTPKQYEYELFSVKGIFPEIGHFRLPFHLFMREDMWSNLKSEITLETYERWLPAVALLSLDADLQTARDMICSNALKQTMTTRKRNDDAEVELKGKSSEPWRLTTREEPLLRAAHRCVRHIANMEWAGACLFYVLQGCTRGADQVAAAHICYQFAQRWAALQPGNRAVRQMERLHATLSTRHALHKIEWACEELVRLSTEPALLIRTLYLHPAFVEKITRFDVNRAANEIADKNGINISSIRIQILENILDKSNEQNKNKRFSALNIKELMTAKYILKATCPKMGAIYLSRIAFDDESDYNKCKKLRALQCLMSVVEPDTAMKVTNKEREALWTSLLELSCIVNLENIDMPWIVATFMQDKIRALEQILQAAEGNVEGLRIAAELARRFGTSQIIRDLIPLLLRAGLYEEMIPLLLNISCPPDNIIYAAWRAIILSPFQRADYPITERQRTKCLNAINLLPICPVIKDEDLTEIWKNCVRCKCFGLGCLVLPYMTSETRQTLGELQKIDRRNLIASLKNLQTETYLVSGAMYVVENMASRGYR